MTTAEPSVRLHLMSGFELRIGGAAVPLRPLEQRLVAFVALALRGVDRSCAAFQLWPDLREERAKANLRSTLWRLRQLPVELLEISASRLRLADGVWLDTREGIEDLARNPVTSIETRLFDSVMHGLLPDWYDDWLVVERERLRQAKLNALESNARAALADGDTASAIQSALSAVAIDPLRESAHRMVIQAHLEEGNNWGARCALGQYRELLAFDETLAPSPALVALADGGLDGR